jgi:hypothetical protein
MQWALTYCWSSRARDEATRVRNQPDIQLVWVILFHHETQLMYAASFAGHAVRIEENLVWGGVWGGICF